MRTEREPNVIVTFKQRWSVFNPGESAGVAPAVADSLVTAGVAKRIGVAKVREESTMPGIAQVRDAEKAAAQRQAKA